MVTALRGVHDAGWVHLDVKPSQFMFLLNLGPGELKVKLADFDAALQAHSQGTIDRFTTRSEQTQLTLPHVSSPLDQPSFHTPNEISL